MKFRAKIEKTTKIVTFSNLAAVIAKLSNETILRLSKKKVYLIQSVSASEEGVLWCDIETKSIFTEYTYQGYVAPGFDEDEIILGLRSNCRGNFYLSLELSASDLCRALEFGNTDKHCPRDLKMKLRYVKVNSYLDEFLAKSCRQERIKLEMTRATQCLPFKFKSSK